MTKLEQIARRHADAYTGPDPSDHPTPYYNILTALRELREELAKVCEESHIRRSFPMDGPNTADVCARAIRRFGEEEVCVNTAKSDAAGA